MKKYTFIKVIVRTDIEFFFNELLYKKTLIKNIPNTIYREKNEIFTNKLEDVTYDL
jgi:replication initiation and membrane attachment protein DnaB